MPIENDIFKAKGGIELPSGAAPAGLDVALSSSSTPSEKGQSPRSKEIGKNFITWQPKRIVDARDYEVLGTETAEEASRLKEAVEAAAGRCLEVPYGTILLNTPGLGGIPLPKNKAIDIVGSGQGATTFKLTKNTPRLWDFIRKEDGELYRDIRSSGYTVDANNITGLSIFPEKSVTAEKELPSGVWTKVTLNNVTGFPTIKQSLLVSQTCLVYFPVTNTGTAKEAMMLGRPVEGSSTQIEVFNIRAESMTVKVGDTIHGAIRDHVLVGNLQQAQYISPYNMSFKNIKFWDIKCINIPTQLGINLESRSKSDYRFAVQMWLKVNPENIPGEPLVMEDVEFDCEAWGGENGFSLVGDKGTWIDRCGFGSHSKHSAMVTPEANYPSLNYIIGREAWVGRVWCHGWGELSGDVGLELDQPWEANVDGMTIEDATSWGMFSTSFTSPAQTSAGPPKTKLAAEITEGAASATITELPAGVAAEGWATIGEELIYYQSNSSGTTLTIYRHMNGSTATAHAKESVVTFHEQEKARISYNQVRCKRRRLVGRGRGWGQITNSHLPLPRLIGRDCEWEREGEDCKFPGEALQTIGIPSWDMEMKVRINGVRYSSEEQTGFGAVRPEGPGFGSTVVGGPRPSPLRLRLDAKASGLVNKKVTWIAASPYLGYVDLDWEIKDDPCLPGIEAGSTNAVQFIEASPCIAQGRVKVIKRSTTVGDKAGGGILIPSTATVTIRYLDVEVDAYGIGFSGSAGNPNYRPWIIDSTNAEAVTIRFARHSGQLATSYPQHTLKRRVITTNETLNAYDEYAGIQITTAKTLKLAEGTSTLISALNPAAGREIVIKDELGNLASHPLTIECTGTDTIDGSTTLVMNKNYQTVKLVPTGSGYTRVGYAGYKGLDIVTSPILAYGTPFPGSTFVPGTAFKAAFARARVKFTGKVKDCSIWAGSVVNGKTRVAIFDVGEATTEKYTLLAQSAEIEATETGHWKSMGNLGELSLVEDQEILMSLMNSGTTAAFGKPTSFAPNILTTQLPEGYNNNGLTLPKLCGTHTYAELSFTTIKESELSNYGEVPLIILRTA